MKLKLTKQLRYDYQSTMHLIFATLALLFTILFAIVTMWIAFVIGLILMVLFIVFIALRRNKILKDFTTFGDNIATGHVETIDSMQGNIYLNVEYDYEGAIHSKRIGYLGGLFLRRKLEKLDKVTFIVNPDNPKKVYVKTLLIEG